MTISDECRLLKTLASVLHSSGRLRVWSLVITIFGDAVQPRGGKIAMTDLLAITSAAGIEPGGLRTAMSRLQKEGWVQSEKRGRHSHYKLSDRGVQEFVPATQRIYQNQSRLKPNGGLIAFLDPSAEDFAKRASLFETMNGISIVNGIFLWGKDTAPTLELLNVHQCLTAYTEPAALPNWFKQKIGPAELSNQYGNLSDHLTPFLDNCELVELQTPLTALTTRILLIHLWRKLVLRAPDLPAEFFPHDWKEPQCRNAVSILYRKLLNASEAYWDEPTAGDAAAELKNRLR